MENDPDFPVVPVPLTSQYYSSSVIDSLYDLEKVSFLCAADHIDSLFSFHSGRKGMVAGGGGLGGNLHLIFGY